MPVEMIISNRFAIFINLSMAANLPRRISMFVHYISEHALWVHIQKKSTFIKVIEYDTNNVLEFFLHNDSLMRHKTKRMLLFKTWSAPFLPPPTTERDLKLLKSFVIFSLPLIANKMQSIPSNKLLVWLVLSDTRDSRILVTKTKSQLFVLL